MKKRELINLGFPKGEALTLAIKTCAKAGKSGMDKQAIRERLTMLIDAPEDHAADPIYGALATALQEEAPEPFVGRYEPAPWKQWGADLDENSIQQMRNACNLPVAVAGALMPDAHVGYGLPIGGVLATREAVIPYAVGMDIACRMKMSVLDLPPKFLKGHEWQLRKAIEEETRFGIGARFQHPRDHEVMEEDWGITEITRRFKDKAWKQLGSSGSGNHFVEFGILEVKAEGLEVPPGEYLALLSHSGSRGAGANVASFFSRLAMSHHPELPKELRRLSWLDTRSADGQAYWAAMNLMGRYAAANHACIHKHIAKFLKAKVLADVENHHNFAWKEKHNGEELIVHRKGATPAGEGVLGIIPGSMASPAYVVRGRGEASSLNSASHGAGRVMSRKKAKTTLTWSNARKLLKQQGVTLMSAGLDEAPMVYREINEVMAAQQDLVDILAAFHPKLVKMAPEGERPED